MTKNSFKLKKLWQYVKKGIYNTFQTIFARYNKLFCNNENLNF